MHNVNEQKYLITWVEQVGEDNSAIRGQAVKDMDSAVTMYNHVVKQNTTMYAEVRKIGGIPSVHPIGKLQFNRLQ